MQSKFVRFGLIASAVALLPILASCKNTGDDKTCAAINKAIDSDIVESAVDAADMKNDSDLMQQLARKSSIASHISTINANINLLLQNGCPPRNNPIRPYDYPINAGECFNKRRDVEIYALQQNTDKMNAAIKDTKVLCDFSKWKE